MNRKSLLVQGYREPLYGWGICQERCILTIYFSSKVHDSDDVSFYNFTASTWTLATPRSSWESVLSLPSPCCGLTKLSANVLQVVCGDMAAAKVQKALQKENFGALKVQVVCANSESGSADAVRTVADKLRGDCVVVMSGDVVTDIPLNAVVFNHNMRGASITSVLCKHKSSPSEGTKAGKAPKVRLMITEYVIQICLAVLDTVMPEHTLHRTTFRRRNPAFRLNCSPFNRNSRYTGHFVVLPTTPV